MPEIHVRRARLPDLAAIQDIVRDAYSIYIARIGHPPGPMRDDYRARIEHDEAWVAECGGEVGGVLILVADAATLQIDNVAVSPARQGQGVGRALLAFAEAEARRRSISRLTLYTNQKMTENLAMYPLLGWRETGRGERDGYARVFFEKTL